jgi:D-alanyl-D-alanine carboxypeptidase/D-alanyl-D-alanine-endopeptidase (penicillin-binding protein 4)
MQRFDTGHISGTLLVLTLLLVFSSIAPASTDQIRGELNRLIGDSDAALLALPDGSVIFEKNADTLLVPASILKVFTALVALHTLGSDFRFETEFYLDRQRNLIIKGYGDPLLISEVIADICSRLGGLLSDRAALRGLILDETYFVQPLTIPGVSASAQPYDAPNGALCVNFNTVNFKRHQGRYVSAEPQTPLLPFAKAKIKSRRVSGGRVVLSRIENENTRYAGELFRFFLQREGIRFSGPVTIGGVGASARRVLKYRSPYRLEEVVAKMLEHSNNFITNQLLIAAGIRIHGAPGSLEKAVRAARSFAAERLGIDNLRIAEGSGISRQNRLTARQMMTVLRVFAPHFRLMRRAENEFYKTGTLHGVSTRAGYLLNSKGRRHPFVIMRNATRKPATEFIPYLNELIQ